MNPNYTNETENNFYNNNNIDEDLNFLDTEIENELKNLHNISILKQSVDPKYNDKSFLPIDDIDLEEYDKIFLKEEKINKNSKNKTENKIKIDKDEINRLFKEYERQIENEINKELKETFKPLDNIPDEDKIRAEKLIENFEFIRNAMEMGLINYEEIVVYIDYYELLSLMEQKKSEAVVTLEKISELFTEDETWINLQKQLEKTLGETDLILSNKVDLNKMLYDYDYQENKISKNKETFSNTFTTKIKDNSFHNSFISSSRSDNKLRSSISSIKSQNLNNVNNLKNVKNFKAELFDDKNKMTNLIKFRGDRRSVLQAIKGKKFTFTRPDLFKFDFKSYKKEKNIINEENEYNNKNNEEIENKNVSHDNNRMKNKFLDFLQMPKLLLEQDNTIESSKKNTIRRRIDDAVNFYKKKLN